MYIITSSPPYLTHWFDPKKFMQGTVAYNLHDRTYTTDGVKWVKLEVKDLVPKATELLVGEEISYGMTKIRRTETHIEQFYGGILISKKTPYEHEHPERTSKGYGRNKPSK